MSSLTQFTFTNGYLYQFPKRMFPYLETFPCRTVNCQLSLLETSLVLLFLSLLLPRLLYQLLRLFAYCCGAMLAVFGFLKSFWRADDFIEGKPTKLLEQNSQSRRCCDHCKKSSTRIFYRISRCEHTYCQRCFLDYCDVMTCKCPTCPQLHHIVCYVCMSAEAE